MGQIRMSAVAGPYAVCAVDVGKLPGGRVADILCALRGPSNLGLKLKQGMRQEFLAGRMGGLV